MFHKIWMKSVKKRNKWPLVVDYIFRFWKWYIWLKYLLTKVSGCLKKCISKSIVCLKVDSKFTIVPFTRLNSFTGLPNHMPAGLFYLLDNTVRHNQRTNKSLLSTKHSQDNWNLYNKVILGIYKGNKFLKHLFSLSHLKFFWQTVLSRKKMEMS